LQRVYNSSAPLEHGLVRQIQDAFDLTPSLPALCTLGIFTLAQCPKLPHESTKQILLPELAKGYPELNHCPGTSVPCTMCLAKLFLALYFHAAA